jgi:hypothetical protein
MVLIGGKAKPSVLIHEPAAVLCMMCGTAALSLMSALAGVRCNPPRFIALPTADGGLVAPAASRYLRQSAVPHLSHERRVTAGGALS